MAQSDDHAEEAAATAVPWLWSRSKRTFIWRANGREVGADTIEAWFEKAIAQAKSNLRVIGEDLLGGRINSAEWAIRTGAELKNLHRSLAMLANGGKEMMTSARWGQLGGKMQRQFAYFNRFAAQVDGMTLTELEAIRERFLRRLESYANAGRNTYWHAVRMREATLGGMMERNQLGFSIRSCSDCIAQTELGWVSAGTLSSPGDRECGSNCHCAIEFKTSAEALAEEAA